MVVEEKKIISIYWLMRSLQTHKNEGLRKLEQVLYENQRSQNNCRHSLGHGHAQGNRYWSGFYFQ